MKVEIRRSELEDVKEKLKRDRGFFFSPCKECLEDKTSSCSVEEICINKKIMKNFGRFLRFLTL